MLNPFCWLVGWNSNDSIEEVGVNCCPPQSNKIYTHTLGAYSFSSHFATSIRHGHFHLPIWCCSDWLLAFAWCNNGHFWPAAVIALSKFRAGVSVSMRKVQFICLNYYFCISLSLNHVSDLEQIEQFAWATHISPFYSINFSCVHWPIFHLNLLDPWRMVMKYKIG